MKRKENIVKLKAYTFSDRVVKMYRHLREVRGEYIISKQVLRSGTSIGANISEGEYAQSPMDFLSKYSIALKEANETLYWLSKLRVGDFLTEKEFASMKGDNEELIKLLTSIVKTKKQNLGLL